MRLNLNEMIEVTLDNPENFLKIKETLTRIGVASKKDQTLYQSCHILHKRGLYYIVHFKEMFALDGKETDFTEDDKARRNTIACLLEEWGLCDIRSEYELEPIAPMSVIKVLSHKEKSDWVLESKYNIGKKKP